MIRLQVLKILSLELWVYPVCCMSLFLLLKRGNAHPELKNEKFFTSDTLALPCWLHIVSPSSYFCFWKKKPPHLTACVLWLCCNKTRFGGWRNLNEWFVHDKLSHPRETRSAFPLKDFKAVQDLASMLHAQEYIVATEKVKYWKRRNFTDKAR